MFVSELPLEVCVNFLLSDLTGIYRELENLKAETRPRQLFKSIFLPEANAQRIKGFSDRLNWAMDLFQVWLMLRCDITQHDS